MSGLPRKAKRAFGPSVGAKAWRSGPDMLRFWGDFGSVRDSRGRSQFSPFWLTLLDQGDPAADEWQRNWQDPSRGYVNVVIAQKYGYPHSPIDGRDFTTERFVELVIETLNRGFTPIIMLTDTPDELPRAWRTVLALKAAGLLPYVWLCIGWEIVGGSGTYTSKQAYDANCELHRLCGNVEHYIFGHLQPGRGSYASNPVERDDPWRIWIWDRQYGADGRLINYKRSECGDDAERQKALHSDGEYAADERQCFHDMPFMRAFGYQTEHEGWDDNPPLWEDRWHDLVPRLGAGMNGWRELEDGCLVFFEQGLYNDYRNEFGPNGEARIRQIATRAKQIADEYGVVVGYGNGAPA